ncbi:sulfurtransferase complex subunit TusB [Atopomonas sediminilitoris]|uniref:sulfurtransferase complex subunit TusB n=1 Tax=Atopomonas sediminilitoris TaxID=2919919 RepID=UPI001F4EB9C5|nr:sulfurtransferase complex subunit TusB [Atopomonas sediminilitoris]
MSTTLHILSHSPFSDLRLSSCLRVLNADDALLLCGDAVLALQADTAHSAALELMPDSIGLFVLAEDLAARSFIDTVPARIRIVDYQAFVDLTLAFDKVNSWT